MRNAAEHRGNRQLSFFMFKFEWGLGAQLRVPPSKINSHLLSHNFLLDIVLRFFYIQ